MTRRRCTGVAEVDPRGGVGVLNIGHLGVGFGWMQCVPPGIGGRRIDHPPLPDVVADREALCRWIRRGRGYPNAEAHVRAIENGDYLEILGTCTAEESTP